MIACFLNDHNVLAI